MLSRWLGIAAALAFFFCAPARATVFNKEIVIDGTTVEYELILPDNYDPAKAYPTVLAFPPGDQKMDLVDDMIESTWRGPAERRGYVVIEPAAPNDERFFQKGERVFPGMLTALLAEYKVLGNKFHIAGISAGGTSAFWIAAKYPQYFYSVTAFPGSLWEPTPERLNAFADLCIYMFVGENDEERTRTTMQQQAETFRAKGFHVAFAVERNEEHVML